MQHGVHPILPRVIIHKGDKIVFPAKRCILRRTLNIYMHIIKNYLCTVNHAAKLHLGLLAQYKVLTEFQLAGLCTVQ